MNGTRRAFTLVELMLVVGIMGLMGTLSVGGYRAMRRGMEERGTMQNVNQFVRNAYQRAMIDRQPTAIYFWNETRREESDDGAHSILVVGRAVAVRRAGRFSVVSGNYLVDEFGDLRFYAGTNEDGALDPTGSEAAQGTTMYLYRVNGNESGFARSLVGQATALYRGSDVAQMMTDADWRRYNPSAKVEAYGFYLDEPGGISWKAGDAYGFEFADITLPNNYVFEKDFSKSVSDPVKKVSRVLCFGPERSDVGSQTISVYAIRPNKQGEPAASDKPIGTTVSADSDLSKQNE